LQLIIYTNSLRFRPTSKGRGGWVFCRRLRTRSNGTSFRRATHIRSPPTIKSTRKLIPIRFRPGRVNIFETNPTKRRPVRNIHGEPFSVCSRTRGHVVDFKTFRNVDLWWRRSHGERRLFRRFSTIQSIVNTSSDRTIFAHFSKAPPRSEFTRRETLQKNKNAARNFCYSFSLVNPEKMFVPDNLIVRRVITNVICVPRYI